MTKQISKDQLLKDIYTERRRLEKTINTLSSEEMLITEVSGNWSVKDILAHLAAWEKLLLDWYMAGKQGAVPLVYPVGMSKKAIDALNLQIYETNKDNALDEVATTFHSSFARLMKLIESMSDDEIFSYHHFPWTGELLLADYIAGNTSNHYAWAKNQIKQWNKRRTIE